ncbi:hypothetical protein [Lysinibacillus varians]|uniref:Uncharacterized protein n=1 Tax=Lysinibacillus varians TaxID=1145276 RepID=A0ABY2TCT4_9BACI|nr:hypothetical protein [Lysinibacillus varians]AHN24372.1 hypothetical protein T479_16395 [Lysinibacillus varians]TKI66082.1 hypothetical protein FC752_05825 [Lysinibacillus varians]
MQLIIEGGESNGEKSFHKGYGIKTAEVIECPDCAFEFGTIHEQSDMPGLYICPNCQEDNLEADIYHLKEENKRLRKALEYYADTKHYEPYCIPVGDYASDVTEDNGEIARQALQGGEIK